MAQATDHTGMGRRKLGDLGSAQHQLPRPALVTACVLLCPDALFTQCDIEARFHPRFTPQPVKVHQRLRPQKHDTTDPWAAEG